MRLSTSQIFDAGTRGIRGNQYDLFRLQNQLSTGRRVLTPQDDPVAASQALIYSQSKGVYEQYLTNQGDAKSKLGLLETQLSSVGDVLDNVRERLVQAGNTTLSDADRKYIAKELEARFSELMGIANTQDGNGNYLFSGYQGSVRPFSVNSTGADYYGDEGQRLLQVGHSRQVPTNVSGAELFLAIPNGNGNFATATGGNTGGGFNQGTGIIDQGSVTNYGNWKSAVNAGNDDLEIRFAVAAGVTTYEIYGPGNTLLKAAQPFVEGQSIALGDDVPTDFGASVSISGAPANGDTFRIRASTGEDMFTTLRNAISTLSNGISSTGSTSTEYVNDLAGILQNVDQALENVNNLRSTVGTHLRELDSLTSSAEDVKFQYDVALSELQDLDYTKAITDLSRKQLQLEAAQISFKQTSQLSLFSIL